MGRPLVPILAFLGIAMVILFLVHDSPLPNPGGDVRLGETTQQIETEGGPTNGTLTGASTLDNLLACTIPGFNFILGQGLVCDPIENWFRDNFGDAPVIGTLITVTDGLGDFVRLMVRLMSFDVPGAPGWVRFPFALVLNGGLIYIVVSLVRGAG